MRRLIAQGFDQGRHRLGALGVAKEFRSQMASLLVRVHEAVLTERIDCVPALHKLLDRFLLALPANDKPVDQGFRPLLTHGLF